MLAVMEKRSDHLIVDEKPIGGLADRLNCVANVVYRFDGMNTSKRFELNYQCGRSPNGRFLRHRFSPKPKVIATSNQFTKKKQACQRGGVRGVANKPRQRSERRFKPNDAPRTKPRPCVKTMLADNQSTVSTAETGVGTHEKAQQPRTQDFVSMMQENL